MGITLTRAAASASGGHAQSGVIASALRPAAVAGNIQHAQIGVLATSLSRALFGSQGAQIHQGAMAATLTKARISASGAATIPYGLMNIGITPPRAAIVGSQRVSGSMGVSLARPLAALSGTSILTQGSIGITLRQVLYAGQGGNRQTGTIGARLQAPRVAWLGRAPPTGSMGISLKPVTIQAVFGLRVFQSGTVFTLSGLNFNLYNDMPEKFRGIFAEPPYVMQQIKYPASLAKDSITKGVAMLDAAVKGTAGLKIVLAQSQGAQVCARWMREHAADPLAPGPNELMFYPDRKPPARHG